MEFADPYNMPDPKDERREREAAIAALAAGGAPLDPELESARAAPVELPEPAPLDLSALRTSEFQDNPPGVPGAIPDLPAPDTEGTPYRAVSALAAAGQPETPRAPEPGEGASSAFRSPTSQDAPVPGQIKEQPPTTTPSAMPVAEKEPPPQQDPFEALMLRGEEQKRKQLEAYDKEGAPGVNGWALLADVAFNHGKSIPGILQQVDNDKRAYREGRQKLLTGAHSDPVNQMLAMERIRTGQGNLDARTAGQKRLTDNDAAKAEAAKKETAAFRVAYKGVLTPEEDAALAEAPPTAFRTMSGMLRQKYGNLESTQDEHARGASKDATARTHANNEANADDAELLATATTAKADANYASQARHLGAKPQTPGEVKDDVRADRIVDETVKARKIAQQTREDGLRQGREKTDADWITKYSNDTRKQREAAVQLDELDDIIAEAEKNGTLPPGLGAEQVRDGLSKAPMPQGMRGVAAVLGDKDTSAYQTAALTNQKKLQRTGQTLYRIDTGASGNQREEIAAEIANATSLTATLPEIKASLGIIRGILQSDIGGEGSARPDLAGRVLLGSRIKNPGRWIDGYQTPQVQPAAAADNGGSTASDFEYDAPDEPDFAAARPAVPVRHGASAGNLGASGTRGADLPPAAASGRVVTVIYEDGSSETTTPLDEMSIAKLRGRRGVKEVR